MTQRRHSLDGVHAPYNSLHLHLTHVGHGPMRGISGRNQLLENRIYLIQHNEPDTCGTVRQHSADTGELVDLRPASMYLMPGGIDMSWQFDKGFTFVGAHFRLELFNGFDIFTGHNQIHSLPCDLQQIEALELSMHDDIRSIAVTRALILQFISHFIPRSTTALRRFVLIQREWKGLLDLIADQPRATLRIDELASHMNMSRSSLSKRFAAEVGVPLKTHILRTIVREARQRILYTNLQVQEIARDLAFADEHYFSRFFKQHVGVSPLQYRKQKGVVYL